jgi:hypothetical protein
MRLERRRPEEELLRARCVDWECPDCLQEGILIGADCLTPVEIFQQFQHVVAAFLS